MNDIYQESGVKKPSLQKCNSGNQSAKVLNPIQSQILNKTKHRYQQSLNIPNQLAQVQTSSKKSEVNEKIIEKNTIRNSSPTKTNLENLNKSCERTSHNRNLTITSSDNMVTTQKKDNNNNTIFFSQINSTINSHCTPATKNIIPRSDQQFQNSSNSKSTMSSRQNYILFKKDDKSAKKKKLKTHQAQLKQSKTNSRNYSDYPNVKVTSQEELMNHKEYAPFYQKCSVIEEGYSHSSSMVETYKNSKLPEFAPYSQPSELLNEHHRINRNSDNFNKSIHSGSSKSGGRLSPAMWQTKPKKTQISNHQMTISPKDNKKNAEKKNQQQIQSFNISKNQSQLKAFLEKSNLNSKHSSNQNLSAKPMHKSKQQSLSHIDQNMLAQESKHRRNLTKNEGQAFNSYGKIIPSSEQSKTSSSIKVEKAGKYKQSTRYMKIDLQSSISER